MNAIVNAQLKRNLLRACMSTLLVLAVSLAASASWIELKPVLAQVLLQRAWAESGYGTTRVTPWPSADMEPIARLRVARLDRDLIVLDNDSGQALAFAPGWDPASARPGSPGLTIISAHRDTQFNFLREILRGDRIELASGSGVRVFAVASIQVIDSRLSQPALGSHGDALMLVTCYPFNAIVPGEPLRFVVVAYPESTTTQT